MSCIFCMFWWMPLTDTARMERQQRRFLCLVGVCSEGHAQIGGLDCQTLGSWRWTSSWSSPWPAQVWLEAKASWQCPWGSTWFSFQHGFEEDGIDQGRPKTAQWNAPEPADLTLIGTHEQRSDRQNGCRPCNQVMYHVLIQFHIFRGLRCFRPCCDNRP